VFTTKNREPALSENKRDDLSRYIWGIINNKKCHLYRIGGTSDHLHILTDLHPTVCLADLIKDIKVSTSKWIKANHVFEAFTHWQDGYGAFTHSANDKNALIEYIKGQKEHHKKLSFMDEYRSLLKKAGIEFDDKYLV
jgi:REP element-mobilizing transposase RayT